MYYGLAKWTQFIFKQYLQRYPDMYTPMWVRER